MSVKLRFCGCMQCRYGRGKGQNPYKITHAKRAARYVVRQMLKNGRWEDLPIAISIPYTD